MIDKQENLIAYNLHSLPGVYAILLGSGVSRSSGLAMGWEITINLVRAYAVIVGEDCGDDPAAWFRGRLGREPGYSEMMELLQQSPAGRMLLIQNFFNPKQIEDAEIPVVPTAAHKVVARLMKDGLIKVIVTTNFDKLMEQALE